ncbi:MAG: hypothetical protein PHS33_07850 [Candidatus Omnitrophica bacterium]|nr:hypothetical protein [Candidatus Omnitrophota bacterium]
MSNNDFKLLNEAESRLDQLFIETGFSANHPCMLDWATVKFALKDARQDKGSAEQQADNTGSPKLLADKCLCEHWWWRSTGFMFCPTCGKQLRAGA